MSKPKCCQRVLFFFHGGDVERFGGEGDGDQQRLGWHLLGVEGGLQSLIHDAFVGGVHVHHDEALLVLGEDVDAGELA